MDVFALNERLIQQYQAFARSFTRIRSIEIKEKVDQLYAGRRFWPEPLLQLNPHYEGDRSIKDLVASDGLAPETADIFCISTGTGSAAQSLKLRRHQEQAIGFALAGNSYVVTTGTGSGKSLCFFIPIVDAVIKAKKSGEGPRTRAIVIYPMNALANSQQEELRKFLSDPASPVPVSFARYTGQESDEERQRIKNNPPDILLTNFMMFELLMTRQSELDRKVIENCAGLRFIVLDELHTYRGRQGADVALLMRRLRARAGDPKRLPICVGTSATMATEGTDADKNKAVADVASRLFGTKISRDAVITETLKRATDPTRSADKGMTNLADAVQAAAKEGSYGGKANAELADDPLAIWVETRLGLTKVDSKPERARPRSLKEAAEHFEKGKRQNQLKPKDIEKIIDTYQHRKEEPRYARRVEMAEIEKNDFNLNISRYISTATAEEEIDLAEVNNELTTIESTIQTATDKHNKFLKALEIPLLPTGNVGSPKA